MPRPGFAVVLSCALAVMLAFAVPAGAQERRVALVIAAENYRALRPLANPVNDAVAMQGLLEDLGFEVFLELNRDARRMRRALEDFAEDAAGADVAAVFFAGHGVEIGGRNYLLAVDAGAETPEALSAGAVALEEVVTTIRAVAPVGLVLLDACREDPFAGASGDGRGAVALQTGRGAVNPGLARVGRADGLLFAFAAAPGATAADGDGRNSPFTEALLRYMGTEGLEVRSALTLVQQEVYDRSRGWQLPYVESGLPSLFFAAPATGDLSERERLLLTMADLTPALRQEVEAVAARNAMPLAPLYAALLSAELTDADSGLRSQALSDAAQAYARFQEDVARLSSDDPRVQALRDEAEEQIALGAFSTARARLSEAAELDASSRAGLRANLLARTLSEADTHALNGAAAWADLRHDLAIEDYRRAIALFDEAQALGEIGAQAWQTHLVALQSLATLHESTGDLAAALPVATQLIARAEARLMAAPDRIEWLIDLAIAQRQLGDFQRQSGDLAAAFASFSAANDIDFRVVEAEPDNLRGLRGFMIGLNKLGDIYRAIDEPEFARSSYGHALDLAEMLSSHFPDDPQWIDDIAVGLTKLGDMSDAMGDLNAAAGYFDRLLEVSQALVARDPARHDWQRGLGLALERRGTLALALENPATAQEFFERALDLRKALAAQDPARSQWQSDVALTHTRLGGAAQRQGRLDEALAHHRAALAILRPLSARDSDNAALHRKLMVALNDSGEMLALLGDTGAAGETYQESLEIARRLADRDPANAVWRRDLAVIQNKLGDLARDQGDLDAALAHYTEARALVAPRAEPTGAPPEALEDLAFSHDRIGDIQSQRGDAAAALTDYRAALALRERLLARDPTNPGWLRNAAISHNRIGDTLLELGDDAQALQAFAAAQALAAQLLGMSPGNPTYLADKSIALARQATVHSLRGDIPLAHELLEESLALVTGAAAARPDDVWLAWERVIRGWQLTQTAPDEGAALAYLAQALAQAQALADAGRMMPGMDNALTLLHDEMNQRQAAQAQ